MEYQEFFSGKLVLVTGGAGFIGSFLVERLVEVGSRVVVVDNLITGNRENLKALEDKIELIEADASLEPAAYLKGLKPAYVFHMASPASPRGYMDKPIETYRVNSLGTHYLVEWAEEHQARMLFASTSEAYGDPLVHPQVEEYWGNVNPIGVRSCYDVSKRFGEMVLTTHNRAKGADVRIVRIFNTYGPRMDPKDGRVMPNFIMQALRGEAITVYGDGKQTRSFCYVTDLVEYILRNMMSEETVGQPINIGNPREINMLDLATMVNTLVGNKCEIVFVDRPEDDPQLRQPVIDKAKKLLGYEPEVDLETGLKRTIDYFRKYIS